jgi:hypothetical protein
MDALTSINGRTYIHLRISPFTGYSSAVLSPSFSVQVRTDLDVSGGGLPQHMRRPVCLLGCAASVHHRGSWRQNPTDWPDHASRARLQRLGRDQRSRMEDHHCTVEGQESRSALCHIPVLRHSRGLHGVWEPLLQSGRFRPDHWVCVSSQTPGSLNPKP